MDRWLRVPRWLRLTSYAVGSRLLVAIAMVAGSHRPHADDDLHWIGTDGAGFFWDQLPVRWLDVWGRWDTMFYWHLARFGYPAAHDDGSWVYHAAYFPLFPTLMRGLSVALFGLEPYLCGVGLAFACFGLAVVYLDKLVRLDASPAFAELVVLVLLAWPGSHFLTCVYPESLALFLAVFAAYCARTGKPWVAGVACLLAAVTRASGVFVCVPVLYELLRTPEGRLRFSPRALVVALPLLSLGAWMTLNASLYGDALYFVHVQAGWGRAPSWFWEPLARQPVLGATDARHELSLDYHLVALAALALAVVATRRRERPGYVALGWLNTLLPLSTGLLRGVHRYLASNFPMFIALARVLEARPRWRLGYLVGGTALMLLFAFKWGGGFQPN